MLNVSIEQRGCATNVKAFGLTQSGIEHASTIFVIAISIARPLSKHVTLRDVLHRVFEIVD